MTPKTQIADSAEEAPVPETPDSAYDRGHAAGGISRNTFSIATATRPIEPLISAKCLSCWASQRLGLQRLGAQRDADNATVLATAAALREADEARRGQVGAVLDAGGPGRRGRVGGRRGCGGGPRDLREPLVHPSINPPDPGV